VIRRKKPRKPAKFPEPKLPLWNRFKLLRYSWSAHRWKKVEKKYGPGYQPRNWFDKLTGTIRTDSYVKPKRLWARSVRKKWKRYPKRTKAAILAARDRREDRLMDIHWEGAVKGRGPYAFLKGKPESEYPKLIRKHRKQVRSYYKDLYKRMRAQKRRVGVRPRKRVVK